MEDKNNYSFEQLLKQVLSNINNKMWHDIPYFNKEDFSNKSFEYFIRKIQRIFYQENTDSNKGLINQEEVFIKQYIWNRNSVIFTLLENDKMRAHHVLKTLGKPITVDLEKIIQKTENPLKYLKEYHEQLYEYLYLFAYKQVDS